MISSDSEAANKSLIHYFVALHIAYHENKARIEWFSQLVSFNPGIMISLKNTASQSQHRFEMASLATILCLSVAIDTTLSTAVGIAFACCG